MANILIAGGTGLIGTTLTGLFLQKGYSVTILTRSPAAKDKQQVADKQRPGNLQPGAGNLTFSFWNPAKQTIDQSFIEKADFIINLAGAGIADKRWTIKRKKEIVESRVSSGEALVKALKEIPNTVKAVINSSAIGWYGEDPETPNTKPFVETDPADEGFLGNTCKQWESSIEPIKVLDKRLVILRTAVVLSSGGGALPEFKKTLRFGIAAILGNGKQMISWIHIDDLCNIFLKAIEDEKMNGIYNAVAPHPVSNKAFNLTLAKQIRGKFYIPVYVPNFVLKIMLGEMSVEVLKSATVSSKKIHKAGFTFQYPWIADAFKSLSA